MTPTRLRQILDDLGWSLRDLARASGAHADNVRAWGRGKDPIPEPIAAWLEEGARVCQAGGNLDSWRASVPRKSAPLPATGPPPTFEGLSTEELLRLLREYHAALLACRWVLNRLRVENRSSLFWAADGGGGRALEQVETALSERGEAQTK